MTLKKRQAALRARAALGPVAYLAPEGHGGNEGCRRDVPVADCDRVRVGWRRLHGFGNNDEAAATLGHGGVMMSNELSKKPSGAPENDGATKDQEAGAVVLEAPDDPGPTKDREEDWNWCYTRKFMAKATTDPTETPSVAETNRTGAPKKE